MKILFSALCLLLATVGTAGSPASGQHCVTGTVVADEDGKPMPGVRVFVKNGAEEAVIDPEGRYAISAEACDTLVFRFVTYEEQQIPVAGRRRIDVRMRADQTGPDSVVVRSGCPIRVAGKVVGSDGEPMPGACVFVKNGTAKSVTDAQGHYAIETAAFDTLVFRHGSCGDRQVRVAGRQRIDVRMRAAEVD